MRRALLIAILTALVYWATPALVGRPDTSAAVYFNHLAAAFLHGRLYLADPPLTHDLALFQGRWYLPFPPGPALLMLPLVLAFGPASWFVLPFAVALGGLSAASVYLALRALRRRGWIALDEPGQLWLTALFAFGTGLWAAVPTGSVWYLAHVVTVACLALAVALAARQARPGWVGLALAGAVLTRPHVVLAAPFFLIELWSRNRKSAADTAGPAADNGVEALAGLPRRALSLLLPPALAGLGLLWYNWARFGSAFDFGYRAANVDPALAQDLARYGTFSLHYLARNAAVMLAALPALRPGFPFFTPDVAGMSIFLVTPALLYLFRRRPRRPWEWAAWGAILSICVPLLLYYNTGWQQFGYRFSLDFTVFAVCLVAANAGRKVSPVLAFLIIVSVLVNLRGVIWWLGG